MAAHQWGNGGGGGGAMIVAPRDFIQIFSPGVDGCDSYHIQKKRRRSKLQQQKALTPKSLPARAQCVDRPRVVFDVSLNMLSPFACGRREKRCCFFFALKIPFL